MGIFSLFFLGQNLPVFLLLDFEKAINYGLRSQACQAEERLAGLEAQLAELATTLGQHEKTRLTDQDTIRSVEC